MQTNSDRYIFFLSESLSLSLPLSLLTQVLKKIKNKTSQGDLPGANLARFIPLFGTFYLCI